MRGLVFSHSLSLSLEALFGVLTRFACAGSLPLVQLDSAPLTGREVSGAEGVLYFVFSSVLSLLSVPCRTFSDSDTDEDDRLIHAAMTKIAQNRPL